MSSSICLLKIVETEIQSSKIFKVGYEVVAAEPVMVTLSTRIREFPLKIKPNSYCRQVLQCL